MTITHTFNLSVIMNSITKLSSNVIYIAALAIAALGFGLRLYALASESLWYDELLQLDIAQAPLSEIFPRLRGHSAVPLDYIIAHFWIFLGRDDGWVRLPAVIVGTLTLPLIFQLGRVLLDRLTGLLFMFLLAIAPFHIHYSQEVRPYALVVLGGTLTVYAFWQLYQTGKRRYFVPLQIGVLIFSLAHIFAIVVFIPLFIFLTAELFFNQNRKRILRTFGALGLTLLLPLLVFSLMGWGDVLYYTGTRFGQAVVGFDSAPINSTVSLESRAQQVSIHGPAVDWSFIRGNILAPFAASNLFWPLLLFNSLVVLGLIYIIMWKRYKVGLLLLLWLVLPSLVIVPFLVFRDTFFASRYIISTLPAYMMLLAVGILTLPRWLRRVGWPWVSVAVFLIPGGLVFINLGSGLSRYYQELNKEDWHLVSNFIATNAAPDDAVIAFHAEPTMNWYYRSAWAAPNYYEDFETIKATATQAERSWIILSIFSSDYDRQVKAWLSEQGAIRFVLDSVIHVYYLGNTASPDQLLAEIQNFALPVDHTLYASLARENRRRPEVAIQYYQLAIEHALDEEIQAENQAALELLGPKE